ncbi:MAG TPA: methyltransferase domain-containing protein [Chloroflexota bacterium]|jgi:cyclopropane fatty-acyl-phospholipid synthase-like methyltransferase|nr:methyltransferase domain-containing protein [Chloroflexota bacterium]
MPESHAQDLRAALTLDQFPRAASYDPRWVLDNLMGPNVLWLTEALSQVLDLEPGMRVLDLGCGRAISSIFLAREFALQVWAADLWIAASDNWQRIGAAGLQDRVYPIQAEAHRLPFSDGFFDAVVSLDAYHYFGTDDLYLGYVARFVRPGGQIGIVVPGLRHEVMAQLPERLIPYWEPEFWSFHSPAWWRRHWEKAGLVRVAVADMIAHGWEHWLTWLETCSTYGYPTDERSAEMLRIDAGRMLGFTRVVAHRT